MRFRRRSGLQPLDEATAYARCHGIRGQDVRIVKLPPRRPHYKEVLATGEELRALFELRLDARESETGGLGETSAEPPGRAARPEALSAESTDRTTIGAPRVLASERASHPGNERRSAKPS